MVGTRFPISKDVPERHCSEERVVRRIAGSYQQENTVANVYVACLKQDL